MIGFVRWKLMFLTRVARFPRGIYVVHHWLPDLEREETDMRAGRVADV